MPGVEKAAIFGSLATGRFRPDSDVDIAIKAPGWDYSQIFAVQRSLSCATALELHLNFYDDIGTEKHQTGTKTCWPAWALSRKKCIRQLFRKT